MAEPGMKRPLDSAVAPPPKKTASGLGGSAATVVHGTMTSTMLQRQNVNMQSSLSSARRRVASLEAQLEATGSTLASREETLSTFERQWLQLEEHLTLLLPSTDEVDTLAVGTPVAPLTVGASIDEALKTRCDRMLSMTKALLACASSGGAPAALSERLLERAPLAAEVARLTHVVQRLETSLKDKGAELDDANRQTDQATRLLDRQRLEAANAALAAPPSAPAPPPASAAPASATPASAQASAGGGGAAEAALKSELEAVTRRADQHLKELQSSQVEATRLRAATQELTSRPVSDEVVQCHPAFARAQKQLGELHERLQESEARLVSMRNDTAHINTLRHSEYNRFEDYRMQQGQAASNEAKDHGKALSLAVSERRSIELQLAQISQTQKRDADRNRDLEEESRMRTRDASRVAKEIARLKAQSQEHGGAITSARAAEEAANEKAKGLELEVQALKRAAANETLPEPAESRWQEALVKLGSAEQRAAIAQKELESAKSAEDALMAEIEELSSAYDEAQSKTDELRQTVALKEEALARAKGDKLRADHTSSMLRSEHDKMAEKVDKLAKQSEAVSSLRSSFDQQQRKASAIAAKKDEEIRAYEGVLARQKGLLSEGQQHVQQAARALQQAQEAEQRSKEREEKMSALAAQEASNAKKLAADKEALQRKLARAGPEAFGGAKKGGAGGGGDEVLEHLRRKVKCSLCTINDKDAIINKCNHAFCRECLQKRLDVRNRKCPACAVQFDYQSVKDLFLTN